MGKGSPQQSSAPTSTTAYQTSVPEYARPYVENMLGATQKQLFTGTPTEGGGMDITGFKPYQPYSTDPSQYVAGFSPLQAQAQSGAANLEMPGEFGAASGLAAAAGLQSMGAGRDYQRQATSMYGPGSIGAYMNPYVAASLQPQLNQLAQQGNIAAQQAASQATGSGAFGGTRSALAQNLAQQNALMAQQAALGQGYNQAYQQAQQAQQFGANLGLQGLGQALQGAGQLGQLGAAQLGAQQGIIGTQAQQGATQQALEQQKINQAIQDYATAQQYPLMQLGFMSNMLRGLPMQATTTQQYQAAPNALSQMAGLGSGIYGLGKMSGTFKSGGKVKGYKKGGKIGYLSGGDIRLMTNEQLEKIIQDPKADPIDQQLAERTLAMRNRVEGNPESGAMMQRAGLGSISTGDMVPAGAGGGIVAFAGPQGSQVKLPEDYEERRARLSEQEQQMWEKLNDPEYFAKSTAAQKELDEAIQSARQTASGSPWLKAGLAAMQGSPDAATRRSFLGNIGYAGEAGLSQYEKDQAAIDALQKQKLANATEQEKAIYARDVARANALGSQIGQLDTRQVGIMNAKTNANLLAQNRQDNLTRQYLSDYQNQIAKAKENIRNTHKQNLGFDLDPDEAERQAINQVNRRIKGTPMEKVLFPEGVPVVADPAPTPSADKNTSPVVVETKDGKRYTFPSKEKADAFRKAAGIS